MKTRMVEKVDFSTIIEMGKDAHKESRYGKYPFSQAKAEALLDRCLLKQDVFCIVVEDQGEIIGFCVGYVSDHFFTTQLFATDLLFYITPKKRGRRAGALLVSAFEHHVREHYGWEIPIMLGITTGVQTEKTARLYQFMGFKRCGEFFIKE